jgi:hypothetical protein
LVTATGFGVLDLICSDLHVCNVVNSSALKR